MNPTETNDFIRKILDACREYVERLEVADAEVTRLRDLLNRAIDYTKNALFFARTYDNKIQWHEIDKLWDGIRDLEKEALAPAPEEPVTEKDTKVSVKEPAPEWRELGPDEIPEVGDQWYDGKLFGWVRIEYPTKEPASHFTFSFRTLRPFPKQERTPPRLDAEIEVIDTPSTYSVTESRYATADAIRYLRDEIQKLKEK